jgi:hypothetical protein
MTIASFAKPAVIAVALLGAVSGTLAVDSGDAPQGGGEGQTINLAAGAEGDAIASEEIVIDAETPVVTVAAVEDAGSADNKKVKKVETFAFEFAEGPKVPIPPRAPQGTTITAPAPASIPADVLVHTPEDVAFAQPFNLRVPKLDLKLHLKLAQLETRVSQLQLESKKLEIASFGAEAEQKEKLIEASRQKLAEAEAEKLKIQIEQQQEQIKALEEALKNQAEELGKKAARMALDADFEAELAAKIEHEAEIGVRAEAARTAAKAKEAAAYATARAKEAAAHAAKAATLKIQGGAVIVDPESGATIGVDPAGAWAESGSDQEGALSLRPGDHIKIEVVGAFPDRPINDVFTIEPMGTVALGATYGRAKVAGLSVLDAEKAILEHLKTILSDVQVQVTLFERPQPRIRYTPADTDPAPSSTRWPAPERQGEPREKAESN